MAELHISRDDLEGAVRGAIAERVGDQVVRSYEPSIPELAARLEIDGRVS